MTFELTFLNGLLDGQFLRSDAVIADDPASCGQQPCAVDNVRPPCDAIVGAIFEVLAEQATETSAVDHPRVRSPTYRITRTTPFAVPCGARVVPFYLEVEAEYVGPRLDGRTPLDPELPRFASQVRAIGLWRERQRGGAKRRN